MAGPCVPVECRRGSEVTAYEHRGLGGHRSVRQCSGIPALSVVSVSTWSMTFLASCLLHHSDPILLQQPRFLPHVTLIVGLSNHYMCYRRRISHQPAWTLASHMVQPHSRGYRYSDCRRKLNHSTFFPNATIDWRQS
jgi:hypothetical protein